MSLIRITSSEPLTDSEARSLAPALSRRLATSLAGRARYLLELLRGDTAGFEDDGGTPLNPQGQRGIDRSGPPWGDAHTHPIWITEYAPAADIVGESPTTTLSTVGQIETIAAKFFVRPFYRGGRLAPYSRAAFIGAARRLTSGTAGATVRVYGPDGLAGPSTSATVSTTGTGFFSAGAYAADLVPGLNLRLIQIELTLLSGGATGMDIGPLALSQTVRRSH
jgi:hypothetical protein